MIIMGVSGNMVVYSAVYFDIERGKALVHEKKRIILGGSFVKSRQEDVLVEVVEDGLG